MQIEMWARRRSPGRLDHALRHQLENENDDGESKDE